jgi:molybdate transport system regulatory protein
MIQLSLRLKFGSDRGIGPGKIRLLELIDETGSISAAARALGMSWTRAWSLVQDVNATFRTPLVESHPGGADGGGAKLTPTGYDVVRRYRAIEAQTRASSSADFLAIEALLAAAPAEPATPAPRRRH